MAALITGSSWSNIGTSLITSVNTSVPVKGNGMALGMTDGSTYYGTIAVNGSSYKSFQGDYDLYGKNVGSDGTHTNMASGKKAVGVTTDASKSGIVGTVTRSVLTVNIFKRVS